MYLMNTREGVAGLSRTDYLGHNVHRQSIWLHPSRQPIWHRDDAYRLPVSTDGSSCMIFHYEVYDKR